MIPAPAHLEPRATREETGTRAFPLRTTARLGNGFASVNEVLKFLDVEYWPRYKRDANTYCNIYAHDFLYLCGLYLPRVWWTDGALDLWRHGSRVEVAYAKTVLELNANRLADWTRDWAHLYGWTVESIGPKGDFQRELAVSAACTDQGLPGFIVAKAPNGTGHISILVPGESPPGMTMSGPLQSQAGAHNHRLFSSRWWTARGLGFTEVYAAWPAAPQAAPEGPHA